MAGIADLQQVKKWIGMLRDIEVTSFSVAVAVEKQQVVHKESLLFLSETLFTQNTKFHAYY